MTKNDVVVKKVKYKDGNFSWEKLDRAKPMGKSVDPNFLEMLSNKFVLRAPYSVQTLYTTLPTGTLRTSKSKPRDLTLNTQTPKTRTKNLISKTIT